jgi:hypothetical protein
MGVRLNAGLTALADRVQLREIAVIGGIAARALRWLAVGRRRRYKPATPKSTRYS